MKSDKLTLVKEKIILTLVEKIRKTLLKIISVYVKTIIIGEKDWAELWIQQE